MRSTPRLRYLTLSSYKSGSSFQGLRMTLISFGVYERKSCSFGVNNFSSLREKSSVYVDVKTKMCRVVLLQNFFTPRCHFYLISRPPYKCGLDSQFSVFKISHPLNKITFWPMHVERHFIFDHAEAPQQAKLKLKNLLTPYQIRTTLHYKLKIVCRFQML